MIISQLSRRCKIGFIVCLALFSLLLSSGISPAHDGEDKRALDHGDYDKWRTLAGSVISNDGHWIAYSVRWGKNESMLKLRHTQSSKEYSIQGGANARFTFDSKYVVYIIAPDPKVIKKLKSQNKKTTELPQAKLEIVELSTGAKTTLNGVASFSLPEKSSGWIAFKIDEPTQSTLVKTEFKSTELLRVTPSGLKKQSAVKVPNSALPKASSSTFSNKQKSSKKRKQVGQPSPKRKSKAGEKKTKNTTTPKVRQAVKSQSEPAKQGKDGDSKSKTKKKGSTMVIRNLENGAEFRFPNVVQFRFSKKCEALVMTTSGVSPDDDGVAVFQFASQKLFRPISGRGNYGLPVFSEDAMTIAFLSDRDDFEHHKPSWSMYLAGSFSKKSEMIIDSQTIGMPEDWWVASSFAPKFTEDGRRLILGTSPIPEDRDKKVQEDPAEESKAKLDLWHWQDPFLQPQQLLRVAQERNRSYTAIFDLTKKKFIQLGTRQIPSVTVDPRSPADMAVGISPEKYNKMRSWDLPGFSDSFLIDLKTGGVRTLLKKSRGTPSLSPTGKFVIWWDGEQKTWFAKSTTNQRNKQKTSPINLGLRIKYPLFNELHDTPSSPPPYGIAGWLEGDQSLLLYDRWDIWSVDPTGKTKAVCLTKGEGRAQKIRFRRLRLDLEQRSIPSDAKLMVSALDDRTKASGFYHLQMGSSPAFRQLVMLDERLSGLKKARNSDVVFFTRSTFETSPDIWSSNLTFNEINRISRANPQQHEYLWGTAELTTWKASDGQVLQGILYKPENFDATKKYPMIVYFYERYSDRLHSYYPPAAGRSTINFSFYVSRGYVVFIPDIPYKTGEPGPSAANSILPGVDHLVKQGFVDEKRIGMQGHSWGGYQTAYLVTQTDRFACAESGAPVSNMTSAYGGIRWGSGMSRMFQYEKTQSRIGGTLWEDRQKYIDNSPLFFADRINTPLLILHNDKDTAVPWYQGIELFVALRRLEKPAWMLNYNDEPHWVMKDANRLDFAKRMQQFFDHYLKGDPQPVWMAKGIPAVDKGKKFGLEPSPN